MAQKIPHLMGTAPWNWHGACGADRYASRSPWSTATTMSQALAPLFQAVLRAHERAELHHGCLAFFCVRLRGVGAGVFCAARETSGGHRAVWASPVGEMPRRAGRCGTSVRCAFTALVLSQLIDGPTKGAGLLAFVRLPRTKVDAFTHLRHVSFFKLVCVITLAGCPAQLWALAFASCSIARTRDRIEVSKPHSDLRSG